MSRSDRVKERYLQSLPAMPFFCCDRDRATGLEPGGAEWRVDLGPLSVSGECVGADSPDRVVASHRSGTIIRAAGFSVSLQPRLRRRPHATIIATWTWKLTAGIKRRSGAFDAS
jgi:hypothetical protein